MSENIYMGLIAATRQFFMDGFWFLLGIATFWDKLRVKKSTMLAWSIFISVFHFAAHFSIKAFFYVPYGNTLAQISKYIYYAFIVFFFLRGFKVYWAKLLYTFLFIIAGACVVNNLSFLINQHIYGESVSITVSATASYPWLAAVFNCFAIPLMLRFLRQKIRPMLNATSDKAVRILCILPLLFWIINGFSYIFIIPLSGQNLLPVFVILLNQISWMASYSLNLRLLSENSKRMLLEAQTESAMQMVDLQQQGYEQLTTSLDAARAQRHDVRFHLSVLSGYLQNNDYQKLADYLEDYSQVLKDVTVPVCLHHTVDVLARHFISIIQQTGAKTEVRLQLPAQTGIRNSDLCVLFGNLFENAANSLVEQGVEQKQDAFFKAVCEYKPGTLVLNVQNSCAEANIDEITAGIGMNSIISITKKYNGKAIYECNDGVFSASVILYEG